MNERAHNLTPTRLSPPVRIGLTLLALLGSAGAVAAREVEFEIPNQDTAADVVATHGTYSIPGIEDPAWVSERTSGSSWDPRALEALGQFFEDTEFVETDYYGPHRDLPDGEDKIWASRMPWSTQDSSGCLWTVEGDKYGWLLVHPEECRATDTHPTMGTFQMSKEDYATLQDIRTHKNDWGNQLQGSTPS